MLLSAARIGDPTSHGGVLVGPGAPTVLIEGRPVAVATTTQHVCGVGVHGAQPMPPGSKTVIIQGMPALRVGDPTLCGAQVAFGALTVFIGS